MIKTPSLVLSVLFLFVGCASQSVVKSSERNPLSVKADTTPPVILISMDGFRADYLDRYDSPHLHEVFAGGVRAKSLRPVFPSVTFPNHFSLVTGLYPEHHGIVSNDMKDPVSGHYFHIQDTKTVDSSEWWQGEPVWVTAEKQGVTTASMFWVGSTALIQGKKPAYAEAYDKGVKRETRVNKVLGWLDLPVEKRPRFITLYFEDVDSAGHRYGPDSEEVKAAVKSVDDAVGLLLAGIKKRELEGKIHLVFVSDHGMARVEKAHILDLRNLVSKEEAELVGGGAFVSIWPKPGKEEALTAKLRKSHPHFTLYEKATMPERFHYTVHPRIAPLTAVADEGWYLKTKFKLVELLSVFGAHGYDNELPSMQGVFFATGPRFKKHVETAGLQSVDVYELLCHLLKIIPAKNDGELKRMSAVLVE